MSGKWLVDDFKLVENTSPFNKDFTENHNEDNDEGYFLKVNVQYSEKLHNLHCDLLFLSERMKIQKVAELVANLHDKVICYIQKKFKTSILSWISV